MSDDEGASGRARLLVLGGLTLVPGTGIDGGPVEEQASLAKQRRKLAVLAVLALSERPVSRETLASMFWPDQDEPRARHSLTEALSHLRRAFGRDVVATRLSDVALAPGSALAVDAAELTDAGRADDDARVVALYAGPLLGDARVEGAPAFERWADGHRARLDRLFVRAAARRCLALARARAWDECAEVARRWLDEAPLSADAALYRLNALKAPGTHEAVRRAAAEYEQLRRRLEREYESAPDPSVSVLADGIAADLAARAEEPPGTEPAVPASLVPDAALADAAREPLPLSATPAPPRARGMMPWAAGGVALVAAVAALLVLMRRDGGTGPGAAPPTERGGIAATVAVLPFVHLGPDSAKLYFTEGMTAEVAAALGGVAGLRVAAPPSVRALGTRDVDPRDVGRRLGVDAVLQGTVRTAGERARVTVSLVRARDGRSLWAAQYDRELRDVLVVQDEIARAIVEALRTRGSLPVGPLGARARVDPETFDLYLRGRYFENRSGEASLRTAIDYYGRAIARDSTFAPAHAGLAGAWLTLLEWDYAYGEAMPVARASAERAVRIDPASAEGHTALGRALRYDWRWAEAEREFRLALAANPSDAATYHALSHVYLALRRFDASLAQSRLALALDPLNPRIAMHLCIHHLSARAYDAALAACRHGMELDPDFPDSHAKLAWVLLRLGRPADALVEVDREMAQSGARPAYLGQLAITLAVAGRADSAHAVLRRIERSTAAARLPLVSMAGAHMRLGERERALARLEELGIAHANDVENVVLDPEFDPLHGDPRYEALLRRVGLHRDADPTPH